MQACIAHHCAACICSGVIPWKNYSVGPASTSATRVYYLSAEEVKWTYTPGGQDLVYGPLNGSYVTFAADPGAVVVCCAVTRFLRPFLTGGISRICRLDDTSIELWAFDCCSGLAGWLHQGQVPPVHWHHVHGEFVKRGRSISLTSSSSSLGWMLGGISSRESVAK